MRRMFPALCIALALSGCVSTPNTKALITPVGAAGYHTFAPPDSRDRVRAPSVDALESMNKDRDSH